jgi:murein DD-endopeptidase MepM/ murein hydrolase activator NlpD
MDAKTIGQKIKEVTKNYQNVDDEVLGQKYLDKYGWVTVPGGESNLQNSQPSNPIQGAVNSQKMSSTLGDLTGMDLEKAIAGLQDPITQEPNGNYSHQNYNAWDYGVPEGTPLKAEENVTVQYVPDQGIYGNRALVTTASGKRYYISHLTSGKSGTFGAGQVYAYSGNTGKSTAPHIEIAPQ